MNETGLKGRLKALAVDMLVIIASVASACVVVFLAVHFFLLLNTGHYLLRALAYGGSFFEKALWPMLILIGFVVFRRQILNALNEVPSFIRHYSPYAKIADGSGMKESQEAVHSEKNEAEKSNGEVSRGGLLPKRDVGQAFEDCVVRSLQAELGVTVIRNVILFNNRMLIFDGVIVRGDMITALEVKFGKSVESLERTLLQFARFYHSISRQDQEHFNVMVCLTIAMRALLPRLVALRVRLPFPVEYRFFDERENAQRLRTGHRKMDDL